MSLEQTILKIRREYSGQEKYRLFLKHLDNIESELREERKKATKLIADNTTMKKEKGALVDELNQLRAELSEYKATQPDKKFVRMSCYKKLEGSKAEWEKLFWELHKELQQLKQQLNVTETKQDAGVSPVQDQAQQSI